MMFSRAGITTITVDINSQDMVGLLKGTYGQILELGQLNKAIRNDDQQTVQTILNRVFLVQYKNKHVIPMLETTLKGENGSHNYNCVLNCENTTNPYIIQSLLCSGYPVYVLEQQLRNNVIGMNILLKMLPGISSTVAEKLEEHLTSEFMRERGLQDAVSHDIARIPVKYQGITYDFQSIVKTFALQEKNKKPLQLGYGVGLELNLEQMYLDYAALEILQQQAAKFNIAQSLDKTPQDTYDVWLAYSSNYWQEYAKMSARLSLWDRIIKYITQGVIIAPALISLMQDQYVLKPEFILMGHAEFFLSYEYVLARRQIFSRVSMLNFARLLFSYYIFQPSLAYLVAGLKDQQQPLLCFALIVSLYMYGLSKFDEAYTAVMSPRLSFLYGYENIKRDLSFDYAVAKKQIPVTIAKRFANEFKHDKPASLMFWQQVFTLSNLDKDTADKPNRQTADVTPAPSL